MTRFSHNTKSLSMADEYNPFADPDDDLSAPPVTSQAPPVAAPATAPAPATPGDDEVRRVVVCVCMNEWGSSHRMLRVLCLRTTCMLRACVCVCVLLQLGGA